jgi:hypothetical protein
LAEEWRCKKAEPITESLKPHYAEQADGKSAIFRRPAKENP